MQMKRKSDKYWEKRIQEQLEHAYDRTDAQTTKALAEIYTQTAQQVQADILKVYSKVSELKQGDIQMNDFYLNRRYWNLLDTLNERLNDLGQAQIKITEPAIIDLYNQALAAIEDEAPDFLVERSFLVPSAVDGKQALFQSWCLDGKNFSDRVWEDKAKMLAEFKRQLNTCIIQGKSPWQAAEKIAKRLDVSENSAYRLMRTETAHAQIYAKTEKYKSYGITQGKWKASADCCEICAAHDNEVFPLERFQTLLPAHPNCRCSFSAVI